MRCERVQEPEPHRQHWVLALDGGEAGRGPEMPGAVAGLQQGSVYYYYGEALRWLVEV